MIVHLLNGFSTGFSHPETNMGILWECITVVIVCIFFDACFYRYLQEFGGNAQVNR